MHDLAVLTIHLIATVAKLLIPGGARAVVGESLLLKHQLLILIGHVPEVMMAWRAFCTALDAGDLASAQQFISPVTRAKYMTGLTNLGPAVTTFTSTLAQPREVSASGNFAEYALTQTYNGSTYLHLIVFRKSDNRWRLEEF